jgi:hypothetical protein
MSRARPHPPSLVAPRGAVESDTRSAGTLSPRCVRRPWHGTPWQDDAEYVLAFDALVARAERAEEALLAHEYVWLQNDVGARCLHCNNLRDWGHKKTCVLATLRGEETTP